MTIRKLLLSSCIIIETMYLSCALFPSKGKCVISKEYRDATISPSFVLLTEVGFKDQSLSIYLGKIVNEIRYGFMRNCSSVFTFDFYKIPEDYLINIEIKIDKNEYDIIRVPKIKKWSNKFKSPEIIVFIYNINYWYKTDSYYGSVQNGFQGYSSTRLMCNFRYAFWHNINGNLICFGSANSTEGVYTKKAKEEDYLASFSEAFDNGMEKNPIGISALNNIKIN